MMNKYNTEDYFSVVEKRTGRKIADCGEFSDAKMLMHMDPQNRQVVKNKFLMGQVIDIEMPKQLPTTNIAVSNVREYASRHQHLGQIKLPDRQQEPFRV